MSLSIILAHFSLGLILFFIINWIGKHSYSLGYLSMSIFAEEDEAPAFNFLIRVLSPIVYLFITAAILYTLKLDKYTEKYYLVNVHYILIRLTVNILTSRFLLLNWKNQFFYWICIITLSYLSYTHIIVTKKNLLPDVSNLANELWIIICVFIYQVFNNIRTSNENTIKRKNRYIERNFIKFKNEYSELINILENKKLIILAYSILIFENFNRPKIIRLVENFSFYVTSRPHSLGIMQVLTSIYIDDKESVKLGVKKIRNDYVSLTKRKNYKELHKYDPDYYLLLDIIERYNGGSKYRLEVEELYRIIEDKFFKNHKDKLL